MGLLSRIENLTTEKAGLLARADELKKCAGKPQAQESANIDFCAFAGKSGFTHSGIFSLKDDFYYLSETQNLDLTTITKSLSTKDFWDGLISDKKGRIFFEGESLNPFFQLFSTEIKDKIKNISIFPFSHENSTCYFFALNFQEELNLSETEFAENLRKILESKPLQNQNLPGETKLCEGFDVSNASLFIISAKLSLEEAFKNFSSPFKELLKQTALKQLFEYLKTLFSFPNCCALGQDEEIKAVIFSKEEIDEKFLQFQLNISTKKFFLNSNMQNLLVLCAGICKTPHGTLTFLSRD